MTELVIIRGTPGSGKTTLAFEKFVRKGFYLIEADQYFYEGNYYKFDPKKLYQAHKWCQKRVEDHIKCDCNVVVSNTFTTKKELRPYFTIAKKYGIIPTVLLCQDNFGSIHNVPEETMEKMRKRFQYDISDLFEEIK